MGFIELPRYLRMEKKAVVIGISGCSSSGKTTLSRLLRDIFPNTFILHEDDFYKPESELPTKHDLLDWDCAEAIDIPNMAASLNHIQKTGQFPPDLDSKEDQNSVGEVPVSKSTIDFLKGHVQEWTSPGHPGHTLLSSTRLCIFDGFLLYSEELKPIQRHMDIKLFLRVSHAKAKARREARSGYVTLEGFWEDPPGYVDKIVWPNYVEAHQFMFEDGNVEGKLKNDVISGWNIECQESQGLDVDMETTLKWAVETIITDLEKIMSLGN